MVAPTAGNGINVLSNNSLRHFDVSQVAGTATKLAGTAFGTLTIDNMSLGGTGSAIDLTGGTLAATFDSVQSTSSTSTGISLIGVGGSLTAGRLSTTPSACT